MALALRNPRTLTIVQTCIIMLIFCFAGCAAGSCLSYGHSCWGAHGKRSEDQVGATMRILAAKTSSNGSPHNDVVPSSKTQWILSRLIAGQPVLPSSDKYRVRWSDFTKDKDVYASPKWEYNVAPINDESIEPMRIPINNESNEKKINDAQGIMRTVNEKLGNVPEIVLVSSNGYDKPINGFRKLDVLELLNERNGNAK
ncbi:hypothetical protein DMN91_003957 [Ooceraea biroi]|uniref:Uncharacterized protein n=2 Tax=Ooceraea biroi TaxID=2015173 RepID=A0A3L8DTP3_OOCBI|nr:uncharacterized protein LOC105283628 isoform X2 [Ooceraea biroi]RLU23751.1 hypothetical protein DMN91_003957 [Ooceraea biroi]